MFYLRLSKLRNLVMDDCSSDDTAEVVKLQKTIVLCCTVKAPIRVMQQAWDPIASYIAFLDADDIKYHTFSVSPVHILPL